MLGGSGLLPLNLPTLLKLAITALAFVPVLLFIVRWAASRFFVVDARFESDIGGFEAREKMCDEKNKCFVCEKRATKKCSRCKSIHYCSLECQTTHWNSSHSHSCREPKDFDDSLRDGNSGTKKSSSIALVASRGSCKILGPPKKVLFPYEEFMKLFNWDKNIYPPCGLLNCGNSCFANVILQCLASTRPLAAYLLEGNHSKTCGRNDWCFLCELQIHVQNVSQSIRPFSPMNILCRLPKIGGNLGNGRQEDAHEFMRFAIDTMQSVCLDEFGGEKGLDPNVQETTLIQHIFGGHLQSQVKCTKCEKISNRYENMMDLTVEIHGDAESLEECLNQFTGKEWLDGENMYKCEGCDQYVKAWKRLTVHRPPNVLTVALKRFQSGRFGKLNKRVTFPVTLNLNPYMSEGESRVDIYDLYAVVVHIDMLNASFFGHYICYTRDFSGNWYRVDDCKVMRVDVEEVLAQAAYMLLYSRRSVRQALHEEPEASKSKDKKSMEATNHVEKHGLENETVFIRAESSDFATEENLVTKVEPETNGFLKKDFVESAINGIGSLKGSFCEDGSSSMSEETVDLNQVDFIESVNGSLVNGEVNADFMDSSHCLGEKNTSENGVDQRYSVVDLNYGQEEDIILNGSSDEIEEHTSLANGKAETAKDKNSPLDSGHEKSRSRISRPLFPRGFLNRSSMASSRKILNSSDLPLTSNNDLKSQDGLSNGD